MLVRCFECELAFEADTLEAVTQAFLKHAKAAHRWQYPQQALRNYAENYAESLRRATGSTERLASIGPVVVEAVGSNVDEWLNFFDHDAFADNPQWASCYCLEPHEPQTAEDPERLWSESRARLAERLQAGTTLGYLARVDGKTAGWVNASFRSTYGKFRSVEGSGEKSIGLACFVVAPPYRRHGVARALLDAVIAGAAARGAEWVEAYPHNAPEEGDPGHFRGPRSLFESRGFAVVEKKEHYTVMRRPAPHP